MTSAKQLRVTAARPGVVNFELPIEKHHTVLSPLSLAFSTSNSTLFLLVSY